MFDNIWNMKVCKCVCPEVGGEVGNLTAHLKKMNNNNNGDNNKLGSKLSQAGTGYSETTLQSSITDCL